MTIFEWIGISGALTGIEVRHSVTPNSEVVCLNPPVLSPVSLGYVILVAEGRRFGGSKGLFRRLYIR